MAAAAVVSPLARSLFRFLLNLYKWICLKWLTIKQNYLYNIIGNRKNNNNSNNNTLQLSQSERRIQSGEAWDEFCDTLKAAGAVVFAPGVPNDIHVQAEGYRYLSRLTRAGLENWVECCNVNEPQLCSIANGNRPAGRICIGSDNPDNLYQHATIDSSYEYEIIGTRGTVQYLSFGTQSGSYGKKGGLQTVDLLESNELIYDDDNNNNDGNNNSTFKILLSAKQQQQQQQQQQSSSSSNLTTTTKTTKKKLNWLRLNSNIKDALFIVRQTFGNRSKEIPAKLSIRCISNSNAPSSLSSSSSSSSSLLTAEKLDNGLQQASIFVAGASAMFAKWSYEFKCNHTNTLPLFDPQRSTNAGGDPNIKYYHSYWDLSTTTNKSGGRNRTSNSSNNKVLRIRFVPPPCISWNFQLNNHWMESLDYRYHTIHTNSTLAKRDDNNNKGGDGDNNDGRYTIIVSEKNPNWDGIFRGNWIETVGHDCGTMCFRWVGPKVDAGDHNLPQPHVEVLDFESL